MIEQLRKRRASDKGFTLIELLIAIVIIGVLATVVIVGIAGLTNNGKASACAASRDAAKAATAVHYANSNGVYPATFDVMKTANELDFPTGVVISGAGLIATGSGWVLTMTAGSPPTYVCT